MLLGSWPTQWHSHAQKNCWTATQGARMQLCVLAYLFGRAAAEANVQNVSSTLTTSTSPKCDNPFTCSDGGTCTQWSDGCNLCGCSEGDVFCTKMYCSCYETNTCVPKCNDNDKCTIKGFGPVPPVNASSLSSVLSTLIVMLIFTWAHA